MGRRLPESETELQGGAGRRQLPRMTPMSLRETAQHYTAFAPVLRKPRPSSWWSERRIPGLARRATRKDTQRLPNRARLLRQASRGGVTTDAACPRRTQRARFASRREKSRSIRALHPAAEVWKAAACPRVPKHFENGGARARKQRNPAALRPSEA